MTEALPVEFEMSCSVADFERLLPTAMRQWAVSGGPLQWRVSDADDGIDVEIEVLPLPDRRIAALTLPLMRVRFRPRSTAGQFEVFMQRFERGFQRGGG